MKRTCSFFLIISFPFIFFSCQKPTVPTVGFYNIDETARTSIEQSLNQWYQDSPWDSVVLDDSIPLAQALKGHGEISTVITWYGANAESITSKMITPPANLYDRFPTSVRELSNVWIPLMADHSEVAYRIRNLQKYSEGIPQTLSDALSYVQNSQGNPNTARWPIVVPGDNDTALSQFITSLIEATWDAETVVSLNSLITETEKKALKANKKARKPEDFVSIFDEVRNVVLNDDGATLQKVIDMVEGWRKDGLMHPDWQSRNVQHLIALMEDGQAEMVFMPLSVHRSINFRVIKNYADAFVPENRKAGAAYSRALVIPAVCVGGIHRKQEGADEATLALIDFLSSRDEISTMSIISGLAPLHVSSETADSQASDVRFYAAASTGLVQDLSSAFTSKAERTVFFEELRKCFW